jgi:hypothetical protein
LLRKALEAKKKHFATTRSVTHPFWDAVVFRKVRFCRSICLIVGKIAISKRLSGSRYTRWKCRGFDLRICTCKCWSAHFDAPRNVLWCDWRVSHRAHRPVFYFILSIYVPVLTNWPIDVIDVCITY